MSGGLSLSLSGRKGNDLGAVLFFIEKLSGFGRRPQARKKDIGRNAQPQLRFAKVNRDSEHSLAIFNVVRPLQEHAGLQQITHTKTLSSRICRANPTSWMNAFAGLNGLTQVSPA